MQLFGGLGLGGRAGLNSVLMRTVDRFWFSFVAPGPGAAVAASGGETQFGQQPLRQQQPDGEERDDPDPSRHIHVLLYYSGIHRNHDR